MLISKYHTLLVNNLTRDYWVPRRCVQAPGLVCLYSNVQATKAAVNILLPLFRRKHTIHQFSGVTTPIPFLLSLSFLYLSHAARWRGYGGWPRASGECDTLRIRKCVGSRLLLEISNEGLQVVAVNNLFINLPLV